TTPWYIFAGGGTGGHLFPALAVVEALRAESAPADVTFFCTQRPIDREVLGRAGIEAIPQTVRPVPRRPWDIPGFLWHWRASVGACLRRFRQRRPAAVVGAGGYASGPAVHAAMKLNIPAYLLNPDAVPGKANRHLAAKGKVAGIFVQWEVSRRYFPPAAPVVVTGCPVRAEFRLRIADCGWRSAARAEVLMSFGLEPGRKTLLVTGASQGARTINEAVVALADRIAAAGWQILHLSGSADQEAVSTAYGRLAGLTAARPLCYRVLSFTDRMPEALAVADLVISRAGASSLAELQAAGKPSILFPYPFHQDRHQWHNAGVLASAGAAVVIDDHKDAVANAGDLAPVLADMLVNDARREAMGRAAAGLDRPRSAADIAEVLHRAATA
ncbi:MAG: UDP-N-acetylglucosamine--N-acetylmuramyl-(pentapeptide) pyrophosphoryl-undecaprenol N-acetylglucosamine transferase, partial [Phycisphaerae bacterium]